MSYPSVPPPPPRAAEVEKSGPSGVSIVSAVCAAGAAAFWLGPMLLASFGLLLALAGVVTGGVAVSRDDHWLGMVGLGVSLFASVLYLFVMLL